VYNIVISYKEFLLTCIYKIVTNIQNLKFSFSFKSEIKIENKTDYIKVRSEVNYNLFETFKVYSNAIYIEIITLTKN